MTLLTIMVWEYWEIKNKSIDSKFFKKMDFFAAVAYSAEIILTYTIAIKIDFAIINLIK